MAKEELLEMRGQVVALLPDAMFRARLETDHEILGHAAGKMLVELTPHDPAKRGLTDRFMPGCGGPGPS